MPSLKRLSVPPLTRLVLSANLVLTALLYYTRAQALAELHRDPVNKDVTDLAMPGFQLVPSRVITHPWTLLTSSFCEGSLLGLVCTMTNTLIAVRYFEKVWGSREIAKFLVIVSTMSNLLSSVFVILVSPQASRESCGGCFSLVAAFLVAAKQLLPEHNMKFFRGVVLLRVKHVPFIVLSVFLVVGLIVRSCYPAVNLYTSFFVGWMYLRFFQSTILEPLIPSQEGAPFGVQRVRGDALDTFAFVGFFPDAVQPTLAPIFGWLYQIFAGCGLVPLFNEDDVALSNERAQQRGPRGGRNNIAERRRQVALKVLEERIGGDV